MIDLSLLLRKYDSQIEYVVQKESITKTSEFATNESGRIWPESVLPQTEYTKDESLGNLRKMEDLEKYELNKLSPRKLVSLLTSLDIALIKNVNADDLIGYDGNNIPQSILHIQNKNAGLMTWLSFEASFSRLRKMLKYSDAYRNYNLMNILLRSAQTKKLTDSKMKKILFYKEKLESQQNGIFPFDWMFKDCEDSNMNVESEIASMRFCKIVDKLREMKNMEGPTILKEKYKQLIYSKVWKNLNRSVNLGSSTGNDHEGLYLLL